MLPYSRIHIHNNIHLKIIMDSSRANITVLLPFLFVYILFVSLWTLEEQLQSDIKIKLVFKFTHVWKSNFNICQYSKDTLLYKSKTNKWDILIEKEAVLSILLRKIQHLINSISKINYIFVVFLFLSDPPVKL